MTETIHIGDTVQALRIHDFPDLGAVTDGTSFVVERSGAGLVTAPQLRSYVNIGYATAAALDAEIAARVAADNAEIAARVAADAAIVSTHRRQLTANTTWYVSAAGSDANDGLSSGGGSFLTLQHAVTVLRDLYDGRGFTGTISLAAASYNLGTGLIIDGAFVGFSQVTITSAGSATLSASQHTIIVQNSARVTISGAILLASGSGFSNVVAQLSGSCHIGGVTLSPTIGGSQLFTTRFGYMEIDTDIHVANGTSGNLIQSSHGGNFRHSNAAVIHFDSNHNYSDATLYALGGEIVITAGADFNLHGFTINGQRYRSSGSTSLILWASGTATSIPGNTDGNEHDGGRFMWGTTNNSQWGGSLSIDMNALTAGTTSVISGVGFLPGMIDFLAAVAGVTGPASIGMMAAAYSGAASTPAFNSCVTGGAAGSQPSNASVIGWNFSAGNSVAATVSALEPDGFTLTWAKAGTVTGTLDIYWRARRGV